MDYLEEILILVKKKMNEQGGYDREAYKEYVAETIEYFKEKGKITEDDDYESIEDTLLEMWPDVRDELGRKKSISVD
jgi:hypothetical protein